jgi:hypothetical protein
MTVPSVANALNAGAGGIRDDIPRPLLFWAVAAGKSLSRPELL